MNGIKRIILGICLSLGLGIMIPSLEAEASELPLPKVMIASYSVNNKDVEYEEETTLTVEVANKSSLADAHEIMLTYTTINNTVFPIEGQSNQVYIDSIAAGKSTSIDIPVMITESSEGYAQVSFTLAYVSSDGTAASNSSFIIFPISVVGNLNIVNINISQNAVVGSKALIGVNYSNDSEEDIYNVSMVISGDDGNLDQTVAIGNVSSGQNGYFENYVTFNNTGEKKVTIFFVYEDKDGNQYETDEEYFDVTVKEASAEKKEETLNTTETTASDVQLPEAEDTSEGISLSAILLAAGLAVVIVGLILYTVRKNKKL